ncbi:hypothetical protein Sango_2984100 [Sesamum angolense]|uniref:Uncharacterized protein n=1 Tax=Sesamum angolense TaxID=2727404 RepID=A0AAE1T4B1_9LAMI|nr:hypothetical protein Sango_2984100 [Sesamum angolense]
MIEGSSVQEHGVKMLSLVEKHKDLKVDLEKETYIVVILQSLPPSFNQLIVNYNMNGLDKDLHELINMLVQYEVMIEKFGPPVFVGRLQPHTKGKGAGFWMRKKGKTESTTASAKRAPVAQLGMVKWKRKVVRHSWIPKDVCIYCREKGHWKREYPKLLLSNQACKPIPYKVVEYMGWSCMRQGTSGMQTKIAQDIGVDEWLRAMRSDMECKLELGASSLPRGTLALAFPRLELAMGGITAPSSPQAQLGAWPRILHGVHDRALFAWSSTWGVRPSSSNVVHDR